MSLVLLLHLSQTSQPIWHLQMMQLAEKLQVNADADHHAQVDVASLLRR